jgi:hypothetical protein
MFVKLTVTVKIGGKKDCSEEDFWMTGKIVAYNPWHPSAHETDISALFLSFL